MKARRVLLWYGESPFGGYVYFAQKPFWRKHYIRHRRPAFHMAQCVKPCANVDNSADIVNLTAEL
jgi:hypothetical protein